MLELLLQEKKQRWCWLSMSVGSSGGTAARSAAVVAAPLALTVRACCGHYSMLRKLAVLPYGMVPGPSFQNIYKSTTSAVSTTDLTVETQLCKLHDISVRHVRWA